MDDDQFQRISKALADPRRREILGMVAAAGGSQPCGTPGGPLHCNALVGRLPIAQPTVSHHVSELARAGLIEVEHSGAYNLLRTNAPLIKAYIAELRRRLLPPERY